MFGGLWNKVLSPAAIERFIKRVQAGLREQLDAQGSRDQVVRVEAQVRKCDAAIQRLVALYAADGGDIDEVRRPMDEHRGKRKEHDADLLALQQLPKAEDIIPKVESLRRLAADAVLLLGKDAQQSRRVVEEHCGTIRLTRKSEGPRRVFHASGRFDFGTLDCSLRSQMVAGTGFEPVTFGL